MTRIILLSAAAAAAVSFAAMPADARPHHRVHGNNARVLVSLGSPYGYANPYRYGRYYNPYASYYGTAYSGYYGRSYYYGGRRHHRPRHRSRH